MMVDGFHGGVRAVSGTRANTIFSYGLVVPAS